MKKIYILLIILLVILAIGQLLTYKLHFENNINIMQQNDSDIGIEIEEKTLFVKGVTDLYTKYNPKIEFINLGNIFYNFININISDIHINTNEKSVNEIKEYYNQNKNKINSMYIYTEEDFVVIAEQLQNIYTQDDFVLRNYEIDTNTIQKTEDGLISFDVIFTYDNNATLKIQMTLSENNENVVIKSASNLDKIFSSYSGSVKKSEVLERINNFIPNVKNIRENSTLKKENEKKQYYDVNKAYLNDLSIYSAEDYILIANQINSMKWKSSELNFIMYDIETEENINEEDYTTFGVKLYYENDSSIHLKISLTNNNNEPKIKLSAYGELSQNM